jgi:hypothetical protein
MQAQSPAREQADIPVAGEALCRHRRRPAGAVAVGALERTLQPSVRGRERAGRDLRFQASWRQ